MKLFAVNLASLPLVFSKLDCAYLGASGQIKRGGGRTISSIGLAGLPLILGKLDSTYLGVSGQMRRWISDHVEV